jgi:hypothetical protein
LLVVNGSYNSNFAGGPYRMMEIISLSRDADSANISGVGYCTHLCIILIFLESISNHWMLHLGKL